MKIFYHIKELFYRLLCLGFYKRVKDSKLDILLIFLKEVGVKSVDNSNMYFCFITFKDGTTVNFRRYNVEKDRWNNNKKIITRWMSSGQIRFYKQSMPSGIYSWDSRSPSWETIFKFKCLCLKQDLALKLEKKREKRQKDKENRRNKKIRKKELKRIERERKIRLEKEALEFYEKNLPLKVNRKLKLKNIDK